MSDDVVEESRVELWTNAAAMLSNELTLARNALRLAHSMILCGEPMSEDARRVIMRGLGVVGPDDPLPSSLLLTERVGGEQ